MLIMDVHLSHSQLADTENHFNNVQVAIRGVAATWIGAVLVGIGALATEGDHGVMSSWLADRATLITSACTLGTLGLCGLWSLDQAVYQRLLGGVFLVGLRMEHLYPSLPPVRLAMLERLNGRGAARLIGR